MRTRLPAGGRFSRTLTGALALWATLGCDDVSNRLASSGFPRDAGTDARLLRDAEPPPPDTGLPPDQGGGPPPDARSSGDLRIEDATAPPDAQAPPDAAGPADLGTTDAAPPDDARLRPDGPLPADATLLPDTTLPADAAADLPLLGDRGPLPDLPVLPDGALLPDLIVLPPFDAAVPNDAGDATTDGAAGDAGDANPADAATPDALPADVPVPDAMLPDAAPLCGPDPVNACGACGPVPDEVCNGHDDDCDGATDEGDADADGMNDCGELVSGLDPTNPGDNTGDPDHDGVDNPGEVLAGTWALPILFLTAEATGDPGVFDVIVNIAQPDPFLQPILVEIFIQTIGRVAYEEAFIGPAAVAADKQLFASPVDPTLIRFTLTAPNVERIEPGELARLRFRRTGTGESRFFFDVDADQLAPIETQDAVSYGVGHPAEPLVLSNVPLLINEVDYDQISTDLAEYIEIVNPNPMPVDLAGLVLEVRNGVTGALASSTPLVDAGPSLPAHGTLVYGMPRVLAALPADVLTLAQGPNLPNLAGSVRILDTQTDPPTAVDTLGWEGARVDLGLCETAPAGEDPNNVAERALGRCPGTPDSNDNATDFVLQSTSPGVPNVCP